MTEQTAWLAALAAGLVIVAALIGFFIGRRRSGGGKQRIEELEAEVHRQNDELTAYRKEVAEHLDQTATLFVSMADSYKGMFEHLSAGYEKLSEGSARTLFQQRVDALLLGNARELNSTDKLLAATGTLAAAGAAAQAAATSDTDSADTELTEAAQPGEPALSASAPDAAGQGVPAAADLQVTEASPAATAGIAVMAAEDASAEEFTARAERSTNQLGSATPASAHQDGGEAGAARSVSRD